MHGSGIILKRGNSVQKAMLAPPTPVCALCPLTPLGSNGKMGARDTTLHRRGTS
jgi:hypothetical protein